MSQSDVVHYTNTNAKLTSFGKGVIAMIPLTVAIIPWGILTGSLAVETGLDLFQSQALSTLIFAGAVQLAMMGMIKAGLGLGSILVTALLITSRHFLYSMVMREKIRPLPLRWRMTLGFLLTDELFAIANPNQLARFDRWYALGGGLFFYLGWNAATLVGIIAGSTLENLDALGLDFAIAATFIALVVPTIRNTSTLVCVLTAMVTSTVCELFHIQAGLLISAPLAMLAGYSYSIFQKKRDV